MSPPCNRNHGFCRARYPQSVWPRVPWAPARDRPASAAVAREPARERREHRHDTPLVDNDAKIASALAAERQAVIPALRAAVDELLEVERKNVKSERVHELARIADHLRARGRYVCAGPSCHKILIKPPRRPRNTNRWPLRGSRLRTSWINTARPSNPFRISVQLVVSHTCTHSNLSADASQLSADLRNARGTRARPSCYRRNRLACVASRAAGALGEVGTTNQWASVLLRSIVLLIIDALSDAAST